MQGQRERVLHGGPDGGGQLLQQGRVGRGAGGADAARQRDPCSAEASSLASRFEKIAPKIDTPNAPPMLRKKVTPDVAVPRSA